MTTNWSGTYPYRAERELSPVDEAELASVVQQFTRIKVAGSGHSFNGIADSESGVRVSLRGLVRAPEIAEDRRSVVVSAGSTYGALVPVLQAADLALANLASLPHITVAGSVATGTHGSGVRQPGLSQAVLALEITDATGTSRWYDRTDARFPAMVVSLGAIGVVTRLRLAVEPSFQVRQDAFVDMTWDHLAAHLPEILRAAYSVSVFGRWVGPGPDHVILKSRTDRSDGQPVLPGATWTERTLHPLQAAGVTSDAVTEQGGVPGSWADRLPHFRLGFQPSAGAEVQSEFFVAAEHGPAAVQALLAVGEHLASTLYVAEIRAVAAETQWLSPAFARDSVAFHFTWKPEPDAVRRAVAVVQQALAPYDPRPHWGKVFVDEADAVRTYPKLAEFAAVRSEFDPEGKFQNDFLRAVLP